MSKKTSQSAKKTKFLSPKKEAAQETTSPERLRELAEQDIALARIVAKNPAAPPDLLKELTSTGDKAVRKGAAANPNTPSEVLLELGGQFPENLLDNPVFDLLLLENPNLLADMPKSSLKSLLKRDFVPASFLAWAVKQEDEDLFLAVATNPETSRAVLEKLTNHPNEAVQQAAKLHVNWAGEITEGWEEIAQEEIDKGKLKVVKKYQPYDLFLYQRGLICEEKLNVPADKSGREKMASNPNTPVPLLEKLAFDKNKWVRLNVALNSKTPLSLRVPLLEKLALDKDKWVQLNVALNSKTPLSLRVPLLEKLALDVDSGLRFYVAFNPNTPVRLRENFDKDYWLSGDIVTTLFPSVEQIPHKQSGSIRKRIASNPNTPSSILEKLALDKNEDVRQGVASNPNTSSSVLEKLALDKNKWVRREVASNPNTPSKVLEKLATDAEEGVLYDLLSNPGTPLPLLEQVALDQNNENDWDRWKLWQVASNPNIPVYLLGHRSRNRG